MYDRTLGNFADDAAHKAATVVQLKQYYVMMIYACNLRLKPIRDSGINLHMVVGGLLISDTIEGSTWTTYDSLENKTFDGRDTMDRFKEWLNTYPDIDLLEPFDHWQVHSTRGISWAGMRTMCHRGVSYVSNSGFNIVNANTANHEVLHTLGIGHDPGTEECPGWAVMWHTGSSSGDYVVTNCTINALRTILNEKIDAGFSCLLTRESTKHATEYTSMNPSDIAQKTSINAQCARHHGGLWVAWSGVDDKLCNVLWCRPVGSNYAVNMEVLPHTSCADNKWCELGKCVHNEKAPLLETTCSKAGDYPNCWERLNATTLGQCYGGGNLAWECCHMCRKNKLNDSECQWGQSHHACVLTDCYLGNKCCDDFCERERKSQVAGCEWGDRIASCDQSDQYQCYTQAYTGECCESCPAWKKPENVGCEWGDQIKNCERYMCYNATQAAMCCDSCPKWKKEGGGDCQYGDKLEGTCERKHCYNDDTLAQCCESCPLWKKKSNKTGCPEEWHKLGSKCYNKVVREDKAPMDYWGQIALCQTYGGQLAEPRTREIDEFVRSLVPATWGNMYLGATDIETEGEWVWSDGTPLDYTGWAEHEPNNGNSIWGEEDCSRIEPAGGWSDISCSAEVVIAMCQVDVEKEPECYKQGVAGSYTGTMNVTENGRTCQRWDDTSTHSHSYDVDDFPGDTTLPENYCRVLDEAKPWCYTTDPGKRWEVCDVPMCPECEYGEWYTSCPSKPAWYCYYDSERIPCCERCPGILKERNDPGCPYGDRYYPSSYCNLNNSTKKKCYDFQIHNICCDTCPKLAVGPTGWWTVSSACTYGDRIEGCTGEMCGTDEERKQCCETCANVEVIPV